MTDSANATHGVLTATFDELPTLVGRAYRGDWFAVEPSRIPVFAHASYLDETAHEVDEADYPDELLEGFHLLSLLDYLISHAVRIAPGPWACWNYGLDRVRFVSPVTAGERMRVRGVIGAVEPRGTGHLVLHRNVVEVAGREKPGFTADLWALWRRTDG